MVRAGCWSSIVAGPADRAALHIRPGVSWPIGCELADGHPGLHAGDGGEGSGRRAWLFWGDFAEAPYSCREQNPCPGTADDGAHCRLFAGHPGPHRSGRPQRAGGAAAAAPAGPTGFVSPQGEGEHMGSKSRRRKHRLREEAAEPPAPSQARTPAPVEPPVPPVVPPPTALPSEVPPAASPPAVPPAPAVSPAEPEPAADPALGSMMQINEFDDQTRTSMVQVIQPDGRRRVVVRTPSQEPVTPVRAETRSTTVPLSELEVTGVQASSAAVSEVAGAADRALSDEKAEISADAGDQDLVRRQVGDALRDVASALARLAESLDPR